MQREEEKMIVPVWVVRDCLASDATGLVKSYVWMRISLYS